jgi:molybdenum cofactor cytidylyltransferase
MVCALVLAAGRSRRMGAQKLLLPVGGQPAIARIVDEVLRSPVDHVLVVIGHQGDRITEALAGRRVSFVANADAEGEMLSSVRCGLRAMPEACVAVLLVLGDQPGITAEVIATLVRAFRTAGRGIVVPTYGGRRGHPLLFAVHYRDEILNHCEEVGVRGLLQAHPEDVLEVEVATPGVLEDMDVPEDYRRMVGRR